MKEKWIPERSIEEMAKLFGDRFFGPYANKPLDEQRHIRLDEYEPHPNVQDAVA
jgi:trans-2-enoyl-CoA reductase